MSKWHAIEGVVHAGEVLDGIEVTRWSRVPFSTQAVSLTDALADPDGEELARAHVSLLPKGAAWGTPDDAPLDEETNLWKFWRSVSEPFVTVYQDMWRVAMASTSVSVTTTAVLEDWERDYGLPNPCLGLDQSFAERVKWLRFKILSAGTITPGDYLNLAAEIGTDILIEEPEFFELGQSDLGGSDELGGPGMEHLIIVWPLAVAEYLFWVGESELGQDLLYDFDGQDALECVLPPLPNAGYDLLFNYTYETTFNGA